MNYLEARPIDLLRANAERYRIAKTKDEELRSRNFAREAWIKAPRDLDGILPPEFVWRTKGDYFFNQNFIEIQAYKPRIAKFIIRGLDNLELYIKQEGFRYRLVTYRQCPRCGETIEITILTPQDLLDIAEDRIPSGVPHQCKHPEEAFWEALAKKLAPYLQEVGAIEG